MELITATTILWTMLSAANGANEGFAYNTEMANNQVTSQYVYKQTDCGKYLSQHLKYNFTYDAQHRLIQKEVLKWDPCNESWKKDFCLLYTYSQFGYTVKYAPWNDATESYSQVTAKQTYDEIQNGAYRVALYNWDQDKSRWDMQKNTLMMIPSKDLMAKLD